MTGDVIEIIGFYDGQSTLDYVTKELITPEQTMEVIRDMDRELLILGGIEHFRKTYPLMSISDEDVREHITQVVDQYLKTKEREGLLP